MAKTNNDGDNANLKDALFTVSDGVIGAAILVTLGVWGGNWLDTRFNTAPLCLLCCALLGGGLGLARLVMKAIKIGERTNQPPKPKD